MALKEISIALGLAAGSAGIANSGYGLYETFVVEPNRNHAYNEALLDETPLIVESVEIRPDPQLEMRLELTIKIYRSGDILVESGVRRQFIPFGLIAGHFVDSFIPSVYARDTAVVDGVTYDVETLRYVEKRATLQDGKIRRTRTFADGVRETTLIDPRSNAILETQSSKIGLTEAQRKAIQESPYRKKIFRARKTTQ